MDSMNPKTLGVNIEPIVRKSSTSIKLGTGSGRGYRSTRHQLSIDDLVATILVLVRLFAPTVTVRDVVLASVRLCLTTFVGIARSIVTFLEQRAGKQWRSILGRSVSTCRFDKLKRKGY